MSSRGDVLFSLLLFYVGKLNKLMIIEQMHNVHFHVFAKYPENFLGPTFCLKTILIILYGYENIFLRSHGQFRSSSNSCLELNNFSTLSVDVRGEIGPSNGEIYRF